MLQITPLKCNWWTNKDQNQICKQDVASPSGTRTTTALWWHTVQQHFFPMIHFLFGWFNYKLFVTSRQWCWCTDELHFIWLSSCQRFAVEKRGRCSNEVSQFAAWHLISSRNEYFTTRTAQAANHSVHRWRFRTDRTSTWNSCVQKHLMLSLFQFPWRRVDAFLFFLY